MLAVAHLTSHVLASTHTVLCIYASPPQLPEVRRGPHVGRVPVPGQRGPPQDPHRHDDHHLQEDLRRPRQAVEVSATGWEGREAQIKGINVCELSYQICPRLQRDAVLRPRLPAPAALHLPLAPSPSLPTLHRRQGKKDGKEPGEV